MSITVGLIHPSRLYASQGDHLDDVERWRAIGGGVTVLSAEYQIGDPHGSDSRDDPALVDVLQRSEVIVALDVPEWILSVAERLRWIHLVKTGTEELERLGLPSERVMVTNARGSAAPEIAEFVLARILEHFKHLGEIARAQRNRTWEPHYGTGLRDKRVCLVGFGSINQRVAALCDSFGMEVVVVRRAVPERADGSDRTAGGFPTHAIDSLESVLATCDVVVSALPETASTIGLFDRSSFAAMRRGALFVNVGRGSCVDEDALVDALASGRPGVAALDVVATEPLPDDDPLWRVPNLRISAHCSSSPPSAVVAASEMGRQNLVRYLRGEPLENLVERT